MSNSSLAAQTSASQLPWRRANVRHTSNELYVDVIESLSVILAPSGRPLSAFAHGTVVFTSKISGVPDLLLVLSTLAGGQAHLDRIVELPVFHPCVRLARWREKPGELSFVPPDGKFVLAGYEVDLLPPTSGSSLAKLQLPASIEVRTGLGPTATEFEVRLTLSNTFPGAGSSSSSSSAGGGGSGAGNGMSRPSALRAGSGIGARLGASSPAFGPSSSSPTLEDVVVSIPIPPGVRNITDLRASRGEAHYMAADGAVEWRISSKDTAYLTKNVSATLRCTVIGHRTDDDGHSAGAEADSQQHDGFNMARTTYSYDDDTADAEVTPYQNVEPVRQLPSTEVSRSQSQSQSQSRSQSPSRKKTQSTARLMPSSACVSFAVKGWLASGIKVESLTLQPRTSRGIGDGIRPYKGVKYLTVSRGGIEIRC